MHKTHRITLAAQHVHVDLDQTSFSFYIYILCFRLRGGVITLRRRVADSASSTRARVTDSSMAAAAAAASTAANTEARRSGSAPRSWRHRQATLLACSETRSEREIEDLEAAEVNTANTKTAAASIAMHRFTGTFADRSHESAYAARIFRMSFPYHAFLLALVLAAAIWVVHQAPDR